MTTIYADNAEINVFAIDGRIILDAYEETPVGHDHVRGKKLTAVLATKDATELRRALGKLLRRSRPRATGPTLALSTAERILDTLPDCVAFAMEMEVEAP